MMEEPEARPKTYRTLCISMYHDDIRYMDELVDVLVQRGVPRACRSALIRHALRLVELDQIEELR